MSPRTTCCSRPRHGRVPARRAMARSSRRSLDEMIAGARVDVAPYKRDPMDFVLWKPSKPGEPGWPSPPGRRAGPPRLAHRVLGHVDGEAPEPLAAAPATIRRELFDIHGGGIDLVFPHHENEIAQSLLRLRPRRAWPMSGCTTAFCRSKARRCRRASATSSPSASCLRPTNSAGPWPGEVAAPRDAAHPLSAADRLDGQGAGRGGRRRWRAMVCRGLALRTSPARMRLSAPVARLSSTLLPTISIPRGRSPIALHGGEPLTLPDARSQLRRMRFWRLTRRRGGSGLGASTRGRSHRRLRSERTAGLLRATRRLRVRGRGAKVPDPVMPADLLAEVEVTMRRPGAAPDARDSERTGGSADPVAELAGALSASSLKEPQGRRTTCGARSDDRRLAFRALSAGRRRALRRDLPRRHRGSRRATTTTRTQRAAWAARPTTRRPSAQSSAGQLTIVATLEGVRRRLRQPQGRGRARHALRRIRPPAGRASAGACRRARKTRPRRAARSAHGRCERLAKPCSTRWASSPSAATSFRLDDDGSATPP